MQVSRDAVIAKDLRSPGYLEAVESAAINASETHYDVPRDAYADIVMRYSTSVAAVRRLPRVAVGDLVETMLTRIGISKDRVKQWLRVQDCGCAKRQKWLNQWGYQQQDRIERLLNKAARWYGMN
jgi:hypothetical protein